MLLIPTFLVVYFGDRQGTNIEQSNSVHNGPVHINKEESFEISVLRTNSGKIEKLPLEEYVVGVVASEMPVNFEPEALKAQSVAARTYTIKFLSSKDEDKVANPNTVGADITDNPDKHQIYKNRAELKQLWKNDYAENIKKIEAAVLSTAGEILVYDNKPIDALFFSTSNGLTENSEDYWEHSVPYLKSVKSNWDEQQSPKFRSQLEYDLDKFTKTLGLENKMPVISDITKTTGNRVKSLKINGSLFTGKQIREKLNLSSSDFEISLKRDLVIVTSIGNGHGVGMSQYGANGMALEGKKYIDILSYYYQDVNLDTTNTFINERNEVVVRN